MSKQTRLPIALCLSLCAGLGLPAGQPVLAARPEADRRAEDKSKKQKKYREKKKDKGKAEDRAGGKAGGTVVYSNEKSGPGTGSGYSTTVTGRPPLSKDTTQDSVSVTGRKLRDSPRGTALEALSQENAGIYVTGRGLGLHGVASGASGSIFIRKR